MPTKAQGGILDCGRLILQRFKPLGTLNDDERHFIKNILAFFAGSDGIVLENLMARH